MSSSPQSSPQSSSGPDAPPRRQRAVKNPVSWYMPRFWHGMRLSTWLKQLVRHRFSVSLQRVPMAAGITAMGAINSVMATVDSAVYRRKVSRVELSEPPLFILGHWRSGTTLLHELLIRDPQHTYPSTYQCYVPHHFLLTQKWFAPLTEKLLPRRRPMDNMAAGWQRPQEDEFALCNLGVPSPYRSMLFPQHGPMNREYLDLQGLSEGELRNWCAQLKHFFQRLAYRDARRIVVKSPTHTARVAVLLKMFPQAKFVHLVRDPYDLYASTVLLWKSLNEVQGLQVGGDQSWIEDYVLETFEVMYKAFRKDRQLLGDHQLVELRYEDLVEDPMQRLRQVYAQLELGDFSRVESAAECYLSEVLNYRPNRHALDQQQRHTVRRRWAPYFEQYGYDVQAECAEVSAVPKT